MDSIKLDSEIYFLDAIERAIYDLSHEVVLIVKKYDNFYHISTQNNISPELYHQFLQLVADHQIRIKLNVYFFEFRQKIINRALNPSL